MSFNRQQVYISPTRIKTYLDCKFKFKCKYIDKLKQSDATPPFVFGPGTVVHTLAQTYTLSKAEQNKEDRKKEIKKLMANEFLGDSYYQNISEQYENVIQYMTPILEDFRDDKVEIDMEKKINVPWFRKFWFYGYIDLRATYKDKVIVTDYKSSKEIGDHTLQLVIYAYCTAKMLGRNLNEVESTVFYTKFNKVDKKVFDTKEVKEQLKYIASVLKQADEETKWTKDYNQYCCFCEYKTYCEKN